MSDTECVALLRWALPRLELRWDGYRTVRGQVCKRIRSRLSALGLSSVEEYRARLEADPAEWLVLDGLCIVTISRFYRDRAVWDALRDEVLPSAAEAALAKGEELRCLSVGCASGEEPYSLSLLWGLGLGDRYPDLRLRVLAIDVDEGVLNRARAARYEASTLRDLPPGWRDAAFELGGGAFILRERFRAAVELRREDMRAALPDETFRLVLCRNVAFTYFAEAAQRETLARLSARLAERGALVVGAHEQLPPGGPLQPWLPRLGIYRK